MELLNFVNAGIARHHSLSRSHRGSGCGPDLKQGPDNQSFPVAHGPSADSIAGRSQARRPTAPGQANPVQFRGRLLANRAPDDLGTAALASPGRPAGWKTKP